jgi:hypothetical protein
MSTSTSAPRLRDSTPGTAILRKLGAFERLYYRYTERNPMHFVLAAEFETALDEDDTRSALAAVQRRHPLLSAHIEDHPDARLQFVRVDPVPPIELTVLQHDSWDWPPIAARELSRPFDRSRAPLMRAVLMSQPSASTILLTFDHTVADGISGALIVDDLVAALNGTELEALPLPPSQEEMIATALPSPDEPAPSASAADPRMTAPGPIRTFDAAIPHLHTIELDADATARLVQRCRDERTTVHSAIVATASHVVGEETGQDFVRVVTPFNFRGLIGADRDCADYFTATRTGMASQDGSSVWDQARAITAELAGARSATGVIAASAATQRLIPPDAGVEGAEAFLAGGSAYELLISNLGVREVRGGPLHPTALWGPVLLCQLEGERVIGVITYRGRLRMVACGHAPTADFLENLRTALARAAEDE